VTASSGEGSGGRANTTVAASVAGYQI